jgi:hypothetical protein
MKECPECNVINNGMERLNYIDPCCGGCLKLTEYSEAVRLHNEIDRILSRTQGAEREALNTLRSLAWDLLESLYERAGEMESQRRAEAEKAKASNPNMSALIDSTIENGFDAE